MNMGNQGYQAVAARSSRSDPCKMINMPASLPNRINRIVSIASCHSTLLHRRLPLSCGEADDTVRKSPGNDLRLVMFEAFCLSNFNVYFGFFWGGCGDNSCPLMAITLPCPGIELSDVSSATLHAVLRGFRSLLRRYPDYDDMRAALALGLWDIGKLGDAETNW